MHTHAGRTLHNSVTLTFGSMHAEVLLPWNIYVYAKFGVDSCWSSFPFRAWTHTDTQSQTPPITLPTARLPPFAGLGN